MLEQLAAKLGKGLFTVCTAAGYALADAIDKGIDKVCENMEKNKGGES
jgi:hypothetical protein